MMNNLQIPFTNLLSIVKLIVVACWSLTKFSAWFIASSIGHIYTIIAACQAVEIQRSDMSIIYNSLNYPDEIAPIV
jgi:hypothetical protein